MLSAKEKCHQLSLQLQIIFQTRRFGMLMVLTFGITSIHVSGQDHMEFVLVDTFSKTPVVDAFLFIEGSSIGTTSDAKGVARLPKEALLNRTIVITHIQYENV
ncbi:MAG: hypothetical protein KTR24_14340, partial [Saprospiraceae bacterium]|nr:hypothetical protein [Saprospiraceae bacterium]